MERAQLVIGNEGGNGNGNGAHAAPDGGGAATPGDDLGRLPALVESLLFAAGRPVPIAQLIEALDGPGRAEVLGALEHLARTYEREGRGLRLVQVAGGWQLRTPAEHGPWVRRLLHERPPRLSRPMLETLAIVAYRQPCTRLEIEAVRGVDVEAVLTTLIERRLARIVGRKEAPGRPLLYATTREFLEVFGLPDLKALPPLRDLGDGAALLDADASTSFDSDAATLLHANAAAFLDTAASLDADTAAFLNADSASLSDCAFHLPSMPSCRAAPSKAGAEAVAAPIPARPTPAVIIEAELAAGPPVQNLIGDGCVLQCGVNSAVRDRRSMRCDR